MAHNKHKFLFIALSWTVLITYLSLATLEKIKVSVALLHKDKIGHFIFYFVFVITWTLYIKHLKPGFEKKYIVAIAVFYGLLMEIFQYLFTSNRSPDVLDVLANSSGAITGYLIFSSSKNYFYKKISR